MLTETHINTSLNPVALQHVHEAENLLKFFNVLLKNNMQKTLLNMNLFKTNSSESFYHPFKQIMKSLGSIDHFLTISYTEKDIMLYKGNFTESSNTPIKIERAQVTKELDYLITILDPKQISYLSPKPINKLLVKNMPIGPKSSLWGLQIDPMHTTNHENIFMLLSVSDKEAHHQFQ